MVTLDVARTPEDFQKCADLLAVTHPNDPLPHFGAVGTMTFLVYDHEDRSIVRGVIHSDLLPVIRSMSVDPNYRFQDASFLLLHQMMEAQFRMSGYRAVFHDVPTSKEKLVAMLKKTGAAEVPFGREHDVRLRKEL